MDLEDQGSLEVGFGQRPFDAGAPRITEDMKMAAARGIASVINDDWAGSCAAQPSYPYPASPSTSPSASTLRPRSRGGQCVLQAKAETRSYRFHHPDLEPALRDLL